MRILLAAAAFAAGLSCVGAAAHPGPKLLTAGGAKERTAMTPGMTYEDVGGVHLFKGSPAPATQEPLAGGEPACADRQVKVVLINRSWRQFRRLRTQGFYSGDAYPTVRYTKGFYSGR